MIKLKSYAEWLVDNDITDQDIEICDECDGEGETECPTCGHESKCVECDGKGKIDHTREDYEIQLKLDKEKLNAMGIVAVTK